MVGRQRGGQISQAEADGGKLDAVLVQKQAEVFGVPANGFEVVNYQIIGGKSRGRIADAGGLEEVLDVQKLGRNIGKVNFGVNI